MFRFSYKLFVLVIISVLVVSCKQKKLITDIPKLNNMEFVYDSIKNADFNFKTLNVKFNIRYEKKSQTMTLKGNLKMLKDSIIWISLSPGLGIEAAKLMCTNDSIYFMDKMNNTLTKGKYNYINNLYKVSVDFKSLQAILTNNFFIYPSAIDEKDEFLKNYIISKDSMELSVYRKNFESVENMINLDKKRYKINSCLINDVNNRKSLSVKYNKAENNENFNLPGFINIKSASADKFLLLDLEYNKIVMNENLTFSFKVPSDYKIIIQ
ncbi:MAG: DUF4292 domain-containing protein [Bacteroidales bacterium]